MYWSFFSFVVVYNLVNNFAPLIFDDQIVLPSTRIVALGKNVPFIKGFVSPTATVVGKVDIGTNSTVWYGAVIRGDVNTITIGDGVTIGDRVMIHCTGTSQGKGFATKIGNNTVVCAGATLHGCSVGDNAYIGEGAQILDGVKVGNNAIVTAGSFVPSGKEIPAGQLWAGMPAKYVRDVMSEEIEKISFVVNENISLASDHAAELKKSYDDVEAEELAYDQRVGRNEFYWPQLTKEEFATLHGDVQGHHVPGRILNSPISTRNMPEGRPDDAKSYTN